ncbi:T9SS type B sorting domain-containing protein [Flavivirga aquimarina]|uniref:T9SS type B sorting domain-containing protein n=1 Tax=Flavivirga aquimarina TaxID=2027862 RepID=A0ABT8W7D7_9FLAO|nr:T9SS type B sorting domain-containing protein [Flavivirga aquimarina]MDO5969036.1 T9SS type B sorting domain-containing protein [Flavivirga aquimarina]
MKKPTIFKTELIVFLLFFSLQLFAQQVPFTPRFNQDIKGDILLIGNNILGPSNNAFNDNSAYNNEVNMQYIDIDGDPTTFSSSSADLEIPNPNCYEIIHAGLYWGAVTADSSRPITDIKFSGPSGVYNDIVGTVLFDNTGGTSVDGGNSFPYACYADVTNIVRGMASTIGTYTVANVSSARGETDTFNPRNGTGYSAGWSLFVVYEDPTLTGKSITSFDGFSAISSSNNASDDITVSGFRTIPTGPVRANFAFAALEGDKPITGDRLRINGTRLSATDRGRNNFFNSSVTDLSATPVNNRNPNSTNTLGFDTGVMVVPNPTNTVIANDDTSAVVRLETGGDTYFPYFFAFAVDIIAPNIVLTKTVEDPLGNDIGGQLVGLGEELNYVIGFQNTGNDDAIGLTIRDVLPVNIEFDYPADMGLLPSGVTVQSYDPIAREIIFVVDDSVVEENDPVLEIRFKVTVVRECSLLNNACDNIVSNQAFSEYEGRLGGLVIEDEASYNTNTGCLLIPTATNFLADIDCTFEEDVILCGNNVELTAGDDYDSYSWSTSPSGTPVIGTDQSIRVSTPGTYYVRNTATAPCQSIDQIFNVITFGAGVTNPIIPFADQVVTCPNDGKELPNIFMCGATDTRFIDTNITDADTIVWERLDETSCTAVSNIDCANEDPSCTWNQVATGPDYLIDTAGQYRLTLNYTGGCFNRFYFNVYENVLVPTATPRDIICTTPGEITVGNVPSGYEYSIDNVTYQASNVFSIPTAGIYTVYVRQIGVTPNPCVFTVPNIQIRERNFTVSTAITQPFCNGDQGSVLVAANDVLPQYYFSISDSGGLINSVGPIMANNYTFSNLNPGVYTIDVSTDDGCVYTGNITIINPPLLTATLALTNPLTSCPPTPAPDPADDPIPETGEITVYPVGGTAPYVYFVNSTTEFQSAPEIEVLTPGTYNIRVVDVNSCFVDLSLVVDQIPLPDFNITKTDILCAGSGNVGEININVTNPNGNSLRYSIDNGVTFFNSPTFTGLGVGSYEVVVEHTAGPDVCATAPQTISIVELSAITGTATLTTPYTCTTNGEITVSGVSGGTSPYTYSIDGINFQSGLTFSGLTDGTYTVTIRDANNCTFVAPPIIIDPLDPPTDLTFSSTALTCPLNTSDVTITGTTGGVGTLEYQIIAPAGSATPYQTSTTFSGLAPGTYTFQVRDANDCTYSESYNIAPLPPLAVVGQLINNITCVGASDGAVRFTVSGTTGFTYTINAGASTPGTSPIDLTGLAAGTYTILVTDTATNCQETASVTVNTPAIALSVTATESPITCDVDGSVVINAVGGWGGNTYTLTQPDATVLGPQGSNTFAGLTQAGTYTVTVTDANGCTDTDTFTLSTPTPPTASIDVTSDLCYDVTNAATLVVTASGGQTPYEYNINGGPFGTSDTFANLTPGTYTIIVRDAYGCTVTLPAQTIAPQLTVSTVLTKDIDCTITPDALITGTITGGTAPYDYEVSLNNGAYVSGGTGTPFNHLTATPGDYRFRITDAQGCQAESNVVTVNPSINPTATVTSVDPTCNGSADGSVQIIPAGGTGSYTYSFNGSATFIGTSLYTGLSAGTYTYQVRDSNECLFNGTVTLTEPTALAATHSVTPFSCSVTNTSQSATVTVTATVGTGTAGYQYSFNGSGYSATNTLTVNDNGSDQTINYSVRDAQGCTFNSSVTITALNPPTSGTITSTPVTCIATTSTVTVTQAGGTGVGTLTYEIIAPAASATSNATGVFAGLAPDTYIFRVTDADGCYYEETYTVDPVINIAVTGLLVSDVSCNGGNDGAVDFTVSDFAGTYSYTINAGTAVTGQSATTINQTGLIAGSYTIIVTDETTGCTDTFAVTVNEPINPLTFTETSTNIFCTNDESQITVTAAGGTPNYTYAAVINGNPAPGVGAYDPSNIVTVDTNSGADLVWDVYVRDANDCIEMNTVTITNDALPTINPVAQQCYTGSPLNITLTGTTFNGSATYSIGSSFQASPNFTISTPGTYNLTIQDDNGCTATTTYTVEPQLLADALLTKNLTCSLPVEATIDVTISGGTTAYTTYQVSTNGGATYSAVLPAPVGASFTYSTAVAGTYQFRITDSQGCTVETNAVTVSTPVNPDITGIAQTQAILCNAESTATIDITIDTTQGLAPFTINVNNDTTTTNYGTQTSGLPAGTYTITVTDANGCTDTDTIVISEPAAINTTFHAVPITCFGSGISSGSIVVDGVTGGTAPYNYYVTGTNGYSNSELNATGSMSVSFDVVDFGLYQILIEDDNGCTQLIQDVLVASPPTDLDISVSSPPTLCSAGGTAIVTIGGTLTGNGPYHFAIYTGPGMTYTAPTAAPWIDEDALGSETGTFNNLLPGVSYTFIIYDELTQCYYFETSTVPVPTNSTLTTSAIVENNITCTGSADGNVSFDITSSYLATTNVTYTIYDSQTLVATAISGTGTVPASGTLSVSNLGPLPVGNYFVLVEEDPGATNAGCSVTTTTFSITESVALLTINASVSANANCNDLGTITAIAQNGTAPYEYQAVVTGAPVVPGNWGSANTFNLAGSITYDIYVRDAYGCEQLRTIALPTDPIPTIDPVTQQCYVGSPLSITLSGTTYNGAATYSIGGAYQTSPTFTINAPGTYTVSIQDDNGCIATTTYDVEPQLLLNANLTQDLTCTVDASITITPSGGTGTYGALEVRFNSGAFGPAASPYITSTDGDYEFRITDSQGCQVISNTITVTPRTTPTLTEVHTDVSCNGGADGSIVITAANGISPYQYSIDNGGTFQASNVFTGLNAAGSPYNVVVRDAKNCDSAITIVNITEPNNITGTLDLTQGLTCGVSNATQDAILTVTGATGGTGAYTYSFDGGLNFTSNNTYTTNTPGLVSVIVRDANGCLSGAITQTVPVLDPPTDLDFLSTPITCSALTTNVTLTTTDGVGTLSYAILSPASATGNITGAASGIFTGLTPDIYLFEVTDANGCTYQESYTIDPVTNITVTGALGNDVSCNSGSNGAVNFTVGNFAGTYSYTINAGVPVVAQSATTINLTGLSTGNQIIVVTDEITDCTDTFTVFVDEPTQVTLTETININANCNLNAQVTVEANGGTTGYTYAFVQDGATPVAGDYGNSPSAVLDPTVNTDWDVYVLDANGCPAQIDVTIATDALPTVTVPALASNQCNLSGDPYTFTIASSSGVGPLEYSIGTGFQSSGTFTVSAPGTYFVTVRDDNGCTAVSPTSVTVYEPLGITPTITALPTCSNDDGVIVINATGGSGPGSYTYAISPNPASISLAGNVFSGVPSGTYTVTITDATTTCTNNVSVTLLAATPVTFTTSVVDVSCNGGSDGVITVNLPISNDNPVYTYELIAPSPMVRAAQTSNVFTGLIEGDYTVLVTSGRGCSDTQVVNVSEPSLLTVTGTATAYTCAPDNSVNTSTLTITEGAGTGTALYAYSIDGTNYFPTNTFDIIDTGSPQVINIFVRDDNGCIATNTVNIAPLPTLTAATVAVVTPIDCDGTGSVDITVTGGSGNFEFVMLPSGTPQASNIFAITAPGDYYFQVNDLTTGCTIATPRFTVAPFDTIDAVITPTVAVTCFTDTNGEFEINVTGYTGPYTYDILDSLGASVRGITAANTSTNPEVVTGMTGGNYTVVVTETASPFCTTTSNVITIDSPASPLTVTATETASVTCDNNVGTITATARGGRGSYEYELTGAATVAYSPNGMFSNLSAGSYIVNVRDAGGCIASDPITLNIPIPITATVTPSTNLLSCFGDTNASITVSLANGGQGSNYSYTLNMVLPTVTSSGPQASPVFNDLGAGTYNVTVTDGYNCVFNSPNIVISEPTQVQTTLALSTSLTCTASAELTLSATGGTGQYTYSDTPNFVTTLGAFATSTTFPVTTGTHAYYVRDANGCDANISNEVTIDPLPALVVNLDSTNPTINCAGDDTGVITATAQGGLGSYIYTLQDTSGTNITPVTQNSPGVFTNLVAGSYQVRVDSGDCLVTSAIINITEPTAPLTASFVTNDVTCPGINDGTLQINASGGTGIIRYAISPRLDQFFETSLFEGLAPGSYQAIAQDELGCFIFDDTIVIGSPVPVTLSIVPGSMIPEICEGDLDGEFSVDITGGTLPYSVTLDDINGVYTTGTALQTQFDFTGLGGGDHIVYVRDAVGCESAWNITFPVSVRINPEAIVEYGCAGNISTNTVTVTIDDSITNPADIDYSLDGRPYQASNVFVNVPAGLDHYIDVRHTNGCTQRTETFDISQFDPLSLVLEDGGLNEIVAVTNGGAAPYEYTLNGEAYGDTDTFIIYESGDYTVTVTDSNGCVISATRYFEYIDVCISNYFTPNGDGDQDEWGPGCTSQYKDLTFDVFDRYGRAIATLRVGEKWDGKYNDKELPTGDYWYILKLNDPKDDREFVGHFTLYR